MLAACLARWSAKARPTFVGKCMRIIDAIAPAVCFLGKVEKALSGVAASGQTDSGVSARLYGTFLSWINDHETDVFVVATVRIRMVGQRRSTAGAGGCPDASSSVIRQDAFSWVPGGLNSEMSSSECENLEIATLKHQPERVTIRAFSELAQKGRLGASGRCDQRVLLRLPAQIANWPYWLYLIVTGT